MEQKESDIFVRIHSAAIVGVEAVAVTVEVHRRKGIPGVSLVGLARGATKESLVRVDSAMRASGIKRRSFQYVINLLPAEVPKEGSALDLAMAMGLLVATEALLPKDCENILFYGELSLDGRLECTRGCVLVADLARAQGRSTCFIPFGSANEAAVIPGISILGAASLAEVVRHLHGREHLQPVPSPPPPQTHPGLCLSDVAGHTEAKRGLEIAAAGGHNVLMYGPPGSGKTMLAQRLGGLLPPLTLEQRIEVTRIHSAAGNVEPGVLVGEPPLRSPHHTASDVAICGGGASPRPGEITLAHRGVLFLDELPEFSRRALESLREPLEQGAIHISRARLCVRFPAQFILVAAMNPCPCGRYMPGSLDCLCSHEQIQRYHARVSGPLRDRIDIHMPIYSTRYREWSKPASEETSAVVQTRVVKARERQNARLGIGRTNANISASQLGSLVPTSASMRSWIERAEDLWGLSSRAITRLLRVSRTIADLEDADHVGLQHMEEALAYRIPEARTSLAA